MQRQDGLVSGHYGPMVRHTWSSERLGDCNGKLFQFLLEIEFLDHQRSGIATHSQLPNKHEWHRWRGCIQHCGNSSTRPHCNFYREFVGFFARRSARHRSWFLVSSLKLFLKSFLSGWRQMKQFDIAKFWSLTTSPADSHSNISFYPTPSVICRE